VRKNKYAPAAQSAEWPQDACNSLSRRIADLEPLQRLFLAAVSARKVRARNTSMGLVEVGAPEMRRVIGETLIPMMRAIVLIIVFQRLRTRSSAMGKGQILFRQGKHYAVICHSLENAVFISVFFMAYPLR
jgi:hypothetical protein